MDTLTQTTMSPVETAELIATIADDLERSSQP